MIGVNIAISLIDKVDVRLSMERRGFTRCRSAPTSINTGQIETKKERAATRLPAPTPM